MAESKPDFTLRVSRGSDYQETWTLKETVDGVATPVDLTDVTLEMDICRNAGAAPILSLAEEVGSTVSGIFKAADQSEAGDRGEFMVTIRGADFDGEGTDQEQLVLHMSLRGTLTNTIVRYRAAGVLTVDPE